MNADTKYVALENINASLKIHAGLIDVVHKLRSQHTLKLIKKRTDLISDFISKSFGILTKIAITDDKFPNAMVTFSEAAIMTDNPLTVFPVEYGIMNGKAVGDLKKMAEFEGIVDLTKMKVHGKLSKIEFPITLTGGLLLDPAFSDAEIAAVIEHELGHIFSFLLRLNDAARVNYGIYTAIGIIYDIENRSERVSAIDTMKRQRVLNSLDSDPDLTKDVALTKALGNYYNVTKTADGMDNYSLRSWEFLADQFPGRLGAARDLYTAMDKMYRMGPADQLSDTATATKNAVLAIVLKSLFVALGPAGVFIATYVSALWNILVIYMSDHKIYDDPAERFERMIQTNTSLLRDKKISKETRNKIIADNTLLRNSVLQYKTRTQSYEWIKRYIFGGRKGHVDKLMQQELEELLNGTSVESVARAKQISDLAKG